MDHSRKEKLTTRRDKEDVYPHSVHLFRFCKRILDDKYEGLRVIDQDIGQILGFDPADCSHWKKGKKNIKSIEAIQSIAKHLGVDEKLVIDLATGELTELDAYREHRGYEGTSIDAKVFDQARKEFYKKNVQPLSKEEEKSFFKMHFLVDEDEIELVVQQIHKKINLKEAPLYLREIISAYPGMSLKSDDKMGVDPLNPVNVYRDGETLEIVYEAGKETSGFVRYQIAKVLADYFMPPSDDFEELSHYKGQLRGLEEARKHAQNIRKNIFASRLLAPTFLMEAEMRQLNPDQDMITQLADAFWMSKNFMNRRLQDLLASQFLKISHKVEGKF